MKTPGIFLDRQEVKKFAFFLQFMGMSLMVFSVMYILPLISLFSGVGGLGAFQQVNGQIGMAMYHQILLNSDGFNWYFFSSMLFTLVGRAGLGVWVIGSNLRHKLKEDDEETKRTYGDLAFQP